MAIVSRGLPERPHLDVPRRQARELLALWRSSNADALERIRRRHPKLSTPAVLAAAVPRLSDAQLVIAREYGFSHWTQLKERIEANSLARSLAASIRADDREEVVRLVRAYPDLLHIPLVSGNWGPPMSHAANLGRLEIVQALSALGAKDHQHAYDRALLQGRIETARWLHAHGARLLPGIVMGCCETLNAAGFELVTALGAPLTDAKGDPHAPLALVLGTYARNPAGKHAILESFAQRGYPLPDTPLMAFHRGDVARLRQHLRRDPALLSRHFTLSEIYPPELGAEPGMHWTPIDGGTLLHLAIDFEEREIFEWLLAEGAEVDAPSTVDQDGFGGHTPLFHTVVCHPGGGTAFIDELLRRGASTGVRASLRKFLDWCEEPRWHEAREVTAREWGEGFPEKGWVDRAALRLLE